MTLEELWELFPVVLSPHRPEWKEWAVCEIESLRKILSDFYPVINHIGSTAVPGIRAKPIVDILVEISGDCDWNKANALMEAEGYICMSVGSGRMSFNKGYTPNGYADKIFHVHFNIKGNNDEIYFRDYLISNPDIAREYEKLKLSLLPKYRHDRDGYTEAKSKFVAKFTRLGKCNLK